MRLPMHELLGIVAASQTAELLEHGNIKRLAVLLDSLHVTPHMYKHKLTTPNTEIPYEFRRFLDCLEEYGFLKWGEEGFQRSVDEVMDISLELQEDKDYLELIAFYTAKGVELDAKLGVRHGYIAEPTGPYDPMWHAHVRQVAYRLCKYENTDAVPITFQDPLIDRRGDSAKYDDVLRLVLKNIPTPSPLTPWEDIVEFRQDDDAMASLRRLRLWINETVRDKITIREAEQKLEDLLYEYRTNMALHIKQIHPGILETLVVGSASFIEDIVKVNAGALAKRLFSLKHKKTKLLVAEREAPGREISFIMKAQNKFR